MPNQTTNRNKHKSQHKCLHYLAWFIGIIILILVLFLTYLTINEYRPKAVEAATTIEKQSIKLIDQDEFKILSFNTGYAGLDHKQDFLMDGGKGVGATDREVIENNIQGIEEILSNHSADFYMIQEIDQASKRTFDINQLEAYASALGDIPYFYAPNFLCKFVPYPLQAPIARIDSGIATFTDFAVSEASRIAMPNPFSWPVRTANLKRCLLLTRMPIAYSDKELVIINLHLEAYDDGEGKIAQTKQLLNTLVDEYSKGNYVIAGGDFNQMFPEVNTFVKPTSKWVPGRLDPLPAELNDWSYVYDDSVPTCRLLNQAYDPNSELNQTYVIDGYIVSPNIEVKNIQSLDLNFEYSDHNPVIMDFKLK